MKVRAGLLASLLILSLASAKEEKAGAFDVRAAFLCLEDLASDAMLGRKSGQPGGALAEDYVASRFKEWGVEPGGLNGTYFQPFTFPHFNIRPGAKLEIVSGPKGREFEYDDGWRVWSYSGSGRFAAEVVFVGYGIHAPEKGYDEFANADVRGKMALLIMETPAGMYGTLGDDVDLKKRILAAQKHGAKGVFVCTSPVSGNRRTLGFPDAEVYRPDFVIIRIEPRIADYIFKDLPTDLSDLIQEIDSGSRPRSYATGIIASLEVDAIYDGDRQTRNVLGRIPGSDTKLKDEYIIVAAHLDHLGINPKGEVMNGANDNASGVAVAMEVARVLNRARARLKRSVVFFLWAAEEQGYQGLNHYCKQPVYPLEATVAYITMDMVGHGSGEVSVSGKDYRPDLWELFARSIPESVFQFIQPSSRFSPRLPDWEPLLPTGVARIGIQTSGQHLKFHTSRDDVDLIKPELLERTGNFVLAAVEALAGEPGGLIPAYRREDYYLRVVRLIDYQPLLLGRIAGHPGIAQDSPAKVRLALVEEAEGLTGDALRVDVLKKIRDCSTGLKTTPGVSPYSSLSRLQDDIGQRRTAVIPGLGSVRTLIKDPGWAKVLADNGIRYVWLRDQAQLFSAGTFTQDGKGIWRALEDSGIMMMVSGLTSGSQKQLLENARKHIVLIERDLPQTDILELMKEKESILGLVLDEKGADDYFRRLDRAKSILGSGRVMIVNGHPFHEENSMNFFRQLTREILQAGYAWEDIQNLFSGTFLSLFE